MGVSEEHVSTALRGLARCPEHRRLESGGEEGFIVPVSLVMSWTGPNQPGTAGSAGGVAGGGGGGNRKPRSTAPGGKTRDADMMVHVLAELPFHDDGVAMDVQYAIRENKRNPVLRQEFFNAFLPIYGMNHAKVSGLYEDYSEGKFVPNLREAIDVFVAFLGNFCVRPERLVSQVEYFEVNHTGHHPGQYTQIQLLPPNLGPFIFDNIKAEVIQTTETFRRYGIVAGPTSVRATGFIAPNSKDFNYFASRQDSLARLTPGNKEDLHRLHDALARSPDFKAITAHPGLQLLLKSASGVGLVVSFNRFFHRVAPMLGFFEEVLRRYTARAPARRAAAQASNRILARALENELSPAIEQEFRRNAERYWRNILDGRHPAEAASSTPRKTPTTTTATTGARSSVGSSVLKQALGEVRGAAPATTAPPSPARREAERKDAAGGSGKGRSAPRPSSANARTESVLKALKGNSPAARSGRGGMGGSHGGGRDDSNDKRRPR
ncbi:unnamed protein product [Phytomonas sp. EM1]|nr:unnamed protein product [Phytomonas sp. EM1]|eukprot:CCW65886.1 unnamed protein product [Phytomonas sp. isolate EM1]